MEEVRLKIINKIQEEGEAFNSLCLSTLKIKSKDEVNLRLKIYQLCRFISFNDSIERLKTINDTTFGFSVELKRIIIAKNRNAPEVQQILERFPLDRTYTSNNLLIRVRDIYRKNSILRAEEMKKNTKHCTATLALFFIVVSKLKKVNGKITNIITLSLPTYEFRTDEPVRLLINNII